MITAQHKASLAEQGFCVVEGVLDQSQCALVRQRLDEAAIESERRGVPTHIQGLDPNANNVRVFNLLDLDAVFIELIQHPLAIEIASHLLEEDFIVSNFTANIAKPGSGSMAVHSDLAIVLPEPWHSPWSLNVIWCLDGMHAANGATRILPGSHLLQRASDIPARCREMMVPIEATAGSVVAMEGRLWHTSGENTTRDEERALLFGYYCRSFIRPQWNHNVGLSAATQAGLSSQMREWLGLKLTANVAPLPGLAER